MTIYNYAVTANSASKCNNCSCTEEYREEFRKFQWIFDGFFLNFEFNFSKNLVVDAMGKVPAAVVCKHLKFQKNTESGLAGTIGFEGLVKSVE